MGAEHPVDGDPQGLGPALPQGLRRQHMRHLRRPDAEAQRPEGAVGRGVGIAADDREAGQRQALLGGEDVDDALRPVVEAEMPDAVPAGIVGERRDHVGDLGIGDRPVAVAGGDVVVGDREGQFRPADLAAGMVEHAEGVERALVQQVPVDGEERLAVGAGRHDVGVPDLVEEGAGLRGHRASSAVLLEWGMRVEAWVGFGAGGRARWGGKNAGLEENLCFRMNHVSLPPLRGRVPGGAGRERGLRFRK